MHEQKYFMHNMQYIMPVYTMAYHIVLHCYKDWYFAYGKWKYFRTSHKFLHTVLLTLLLIKEKKLFLQENAISNNVRTQIMYK